MPITPPTLYKGVKYIRIHKNDLNGLTLGSSFTFAEDLTVVHGNGTYIYTIQSITKDPNNPSVYYLQVTTTKSAAPTNTTSALTTFSPSTVQDIDYNEYNAIINNAVSSELSNIHYQVDREVVQPLPSNLDAILNGSAQPAEVSPQITSATGMVNARYNGSRLGENFNNRPTLETKIPFFATFDSIRQTSDIGGMYQYNIPYVINSDGDTLPTTDTQTLFYDMPYIFTQEKSANSTTRFSELSPVSEQRQQRKFTDTFEVYKGGADIRTLATSTSGSINSIGNTLTVKSGSFFNDIFFGEDTGVGIYKVEATLSGSEEEGSRTQITKNTEYTVEYEETEDTQNLFLDNVYSLGVGEIAECDLNFNSVVLLAYDRQGTGWKTDIQTNVRLEKSTDGGTTWNTVKEIIIPRFWNRYDINASQIPANVTLVGYRKIDGITGVYLAVNVDSGFISFGGSSSSHQMRTVVEYQTSGNDRCYAHSKFEFLDGNGMRISRTLSVGLNSTILSTTGAALAALSAPVILGAAVGGLAITAALTYRSALGQIKYKDTGINQKYVRIIFNEALTNLSPVLYRFLKKLNPIQQ
jgi:hypothetical protein